MRWLHIWALAAVLSLSFMPSSVFADDTTFQQEIKPLDCTKSETINGNDPTVNLRPKECHDFIDDPAQDIDRGGLQRPGELETPLDSPNTLPVDGTELFHDPTADGMIVFLLGFGIILLAIFLRAFSLGMLRKPSKLAIIKRRVSSFGRRHKD